MGVYKEGKNWKVQVYYKDWQGNQKRKQKRGFRTKGRSKRSGRRDFLQQQEPGWWSIELRVTLPGKYYYKEYGCQTS